MKFRVIYSLSPQYMTFPESKVTFFKQVSFNIMHMDFFKSSFSFNLLSWMGGLWEVNSDNFYYLPGFNRVVTFGGPTVFFEFGMSIPVKSTGSSQFTHFCNPNGPLSFGLVVIYSFKKSFTFWI